MSEKLKKDGTPRKPKTSSEYRVLPGGEGLLKLCETVTKNFSDIQQYEEQIATLVASGFSEQMAREKWKAPMAFNEVHLLRKYVRMAIQRPEVSVDSIVLVAIAKELANHIGPKNLMVSRTQKQDEQENQITP